MTRSRTIAAPAWSRAAHHRGIAHAFIVTSPAHVHKSMVPPGTPPPAGTVRHPPVRPNGARATSPATAHLLPAGRVPWPPLLPGAIVTGAALTVLSVIAKVYVPNALNHSLERYGSLGDVFTVLSWLIGLCVVISVGITAGAVIAREPAVVRRLGSPD
ncbi:hypothetical protein [Streptomyces sp. NPDC002685]|uniref:hypothetical protein n=1 Tax=Streptomyces sp. NPDC002685 TaxID=3154540 RepID=UPI00332B6376